MEIIRRGDVILSYADITFDEARVILITGGAGFIGSNLCEAFLKKGCYVRCLDNLSNGKLENLDTILRHPKFQFILGDIRNYEDCLLACKEAHYVLHHAAWGSVPKSVLLPRLYEDINIKGTLNLLEAARACSVHRVIYASSSSVYGDQAVLPMKEGSEGRLLSPYAVTKRVNEEYGMLYTRLYGLDTYGLRYFNVFGRRQDPNSAYAAVIPRFIHRLLKQEQAEIYGDGQQSRDFTYIENVIEANMRACFAPKEAAGQVFNIACGATISLTELHRELCGLLDCAIPPAYLPERTGDIRHSLADISKAKAVLGYTAAWSLRQGIREAVEWYKEYMSYDDKKTDH